VSTVGYERQRGTQRAPEQDFYARYAWCLNPLQPLDQLLARLGEELDWYPALEMEWEQEEARINIYLLTCAISCTVADSMSPRLPSFKKIAARWPRAGFALGIAGATLMAGERLYGSVVNRDVWQWQREWNRCVELACEILLHQLGADTLETVQLTEISHRLEGTFPERLRSRRMQLPSGFRAQDLTHHDVIALADAFDRSHDDREGELAIVGARTAGAYFAPLIHARLRQRGWKSSWTSVRPKNGLGHWEEKKLRAMTNQAARVLIVDDHPDTGETIHLMVDLVEDCGIERSKITVVVPSHEAQLDAAALTGGYVDVELVTIAAEDSYKHQLLAGETLRPMLEKLLSGEYPGARVIDDEPTEAVNRRLAAHLYDDFQVHLKRVYALRVPGEGGRIHRVLVKSVGWGWLSYHAYLAGTRLHEFVPKAYGLREGMLFSQWIEESPLPAQPEGELAERLAAYMAARVKLLSLAESPGVGQMAPGVNGGYTLVKVLRGVYPPYLRWLKMRALWNRLKAYGTPQPTFIDGNLGAKEWLSDGKKPLKIDYEHHGFGNPAPNIVDAAYDLALATLQLDLSPEAQRCLLEEFVRLTGDDAVGERVVLHALGCGRLTAELACNNLMRARTEEGRRLHEAVHIEACNFLTYTMVKFCAEQFGQPQPKDWTSRLFFMDIDGVFDRSCFSLPHTTQSGMAALATLNRHGYSVVLNTGRPVGHVRQYCSGYALTGGIAEYGCVFVDQINQRETLLVDEASCEKLAWLRERLAAESGVFLDQTYEVAIRAYRIENGHAVGLSEAFIHEVLKEFPQLTFISSPVDTYFFPVEAGKGSATARVMELRSVSRKACASIGDTENDLEMLGNVANAYVPANASKAMRRQARERGYSLMSAPYQRGLLQAAQELTMDPQDMLAGNAEDLPSEHILKALLSVGDRTPWQHFMAMLNFDRL
jgi:hydroxymethylpyrimidine pyrophosphatase-like HAD family hydrolase/orotate phosphoribosyltransferase